ncbi:YceI family protein [Massilia sp. R2A-15]|uniref:YceI family protein n=1 Tax=Massilia sp. R2A-15 TaxID=3064278 RepID=UPI002733580A|nr:YceI family protein [Massilia sp. R2A-15]WLI91571.1 YceI family protein [Massilia sp. R2A-15]
MAGRARQVSALLALAGALAGCARVAPPAPPSPQLDAFAWYRQAGGKVLAIDPAQSLIAVTVRRGGPFARFGHDHVVASRTVTGFAAPDQGRADFSFRLDQMSVDEAQLRREAGFGAPPPDDAIAGTRANMLGRVLDAERFPVVSLHAERRAGQPVQLTVTLHGVSRTVAVEPHIDESAGGLTASGTLQLRQSDFGITPMSVLGGAMTVMDTMELRYRIVARPR